MWFGAILVIPLTLGACSKSGKSQTDVTDDKLVMWPISEPLTKAGYIPGTDLEAIRIHLLDRHPEKDKFETTDQYNKRFQELLIADKIKGFDISKLYLFSSLADWDYDADTQTLKLKVMFSRFSNIDMGTYEGSNAFGAKVTIHKEINSWTHQHFFKPGERPIYCYKGSEATPLDKKKWVKSWDNGSFSSSREFQINMSPDRAKELPKYIQILTIESFDTRDLIRDKISSDSLCLISSKTETTTPTFDNPNDKIELTTDINARLLRLIMRNQKTGEILDDVSFTPNKDREQRVN